MEREGPFWDAVKGRVPLPAAAVTLGWELVSINPEQGTIEVAFTATEAFLNLTFIRLVRKSCAVDLG